jgi:hypothetical protein
MSMTNRDETSVTFSLAELARMEEERVRADDARAREARAREARERREAEAARRVAEAAQIAADAEARAKRAREAAEEQAKREAREKIAADVARIEAEARARLEADNAARGHELRALEIREQGGRKRLVAALVAVVGIAVIGGAGAAYTVDRRVAALTSEAQSLRETQQALGREREHAKAGDLAALDRRHALLKGRAAAKDAGEAAIAANAARRAVDEKALDQQRLRAFADALDALEAREATVDRLAALDRRLADLAAWSADRKRESTLGAARSAAARAKASPDESALAAYAAALDAARDGLAHGPGGIPRPDRPDRDPGKPGPCDPNDPLVGLDCKRL